MTPREILIKARSLIENPDNWIKGKMFEEDACCALGAVYRAEPNLTTARGSALVALRYAVLQYPGIMSFNDDEGTTHADVLRAFDEATTLIGATSR